MTLLATCAGIMEELYCAVDGKNANMCPALVKAAARHLESYVQVELSLMTLPFESVASHIRHVP